MFYCGNIDVLITSQTSLRILCKVVYIHHNTFSEISDKILNPKNVVSANSGERELEPAHSAETLLTLSISLGSS